MSPQRPQPATSDQQGAHAGQALVEYLLVLSVVALLCLPAFAFLQGATVGAFGTQAAQLNVPRLGVTPGTGGAATYSYPAGDEQCKGGLWVTYYTPAGTFKNQGDCQSWVATNGRNAPALTPTP